MDLSDINKESRGSCDCVCDAMMGSASGCSRRFKQLAERTKACVRVDKLDSDDQDVEYNCLDYVAFTRSVVVPSLSQ